MSDTIGLPIYNSKSILLKDIPSVTMDVFRDQIIHRVWEEERIVALFGQPLSGEFVRIFAVLADDHQGKLSILSTDVKESYPALTPHCLSAHLFEREIAEQTGIKPEEHPWFKPIRFHESYCSNRDAWGRKAGEMIVPGATDFFQVVGEGIHEVAVGPVHAGIIEPGHFRFQCHGENVFHLEISLGYQHRGIEKALIGGPTSRTLHYMETLAGDTTIGHALAYAQAFEALSHARIPARAQFLRGVALELERLANHAGDLGALANDVGFLPTASYCGRLRGDFLNMTALLCGNRFGRDFIRPGGVVFDVDDNLIGQLTDRLHKAYQDLSGAVNLLWDTPSVMDRFEDTGKISLGTCEDLGLVGPVARSCGIERDIRFNFPSGIYRLTQIPVSSCLSGDVFARAFVRWLEIQRSVEFIQDQLKILPEGPTRVKPAPLTPGSLTVSLAEGWRGEICHVALTDDRGQFSHYKIIDPSFHNWMGLAMALRNEQVSDFPLCNKSFNLSYCGHDL